MANAVLPKVAGRSSLISLETPLVACQSNETPIIPAAVRQTPHAREMWFRAGFRAGRPLAAIIAPCFVAAVMHVAVALVVAVTLGAPAWAENVEVSARRSLERIGFTNDEIVDGFFKVAFGAELRVAGGGDRIRKFDGPVRIFVDNRAKVDRPDIADRRAVIAAVVADIREHVDHLDVALTDDRRAANVVVTLVHDRDLRHTIRAFYGADRARQIEQRLAPECLSGFSEDPQHRIRRAEVILGVYGGDFRFSDCAYEELLQALGPINDDRSVPWTMFSDDVQMGFFDIYDQYLLNILYDSRVRPGMTRAEVKALLPDVLPAVRERVARANPRLGAELQKSEIDCDCLLPAPESFASQD